MVVFPRASFTQEPANSPVTIPDANLRAKIAEALGKSSDAQITADDMLALTWFEAPDANIQDLTGLEHAHKLQGLFIYDNLISDVSLLTGLTNLIYLGLDNNRISDVSSLAGLTNLTSMSLSDNRISDVSPLTGLTKLTILVLSDNRIRDVSPLAGLTKLTRLYLYGNHISDVSLLTKLTKLTNLELNKNSISDISPAFAQLTELTSLGLESNHISDVSSLTKLTKLTNLNIANNRISDVSSLTKLTKLTNLNIHSNRISDVSPLAKLTELINLQLGGNRVSDISALAQLTELTNLQLDGNHISDVSLLTKLTKLTNLGLGFNRISDVSPLTKLTKLNQLRLNNNNISDISPLVGLNLTGTAWDSIGLYIKDNPLSYTSIHRHIPAMQSKGIAIDFYPRIPRLVVKISKGTFTEGVVNRTLPLPFVVEVRDQDNLVFAEVPVTFGVTAGEGHLSATSAVTDLNGRAKTYLTLGQTPGTTTVSVTAAKVTQSVQFTATAVLISSLVSISDTNLRASIAETLDKPYDGTITIADMLKLTTLNADNANIYDLTGLQHAANLTTLSLNNNNLSDIAPLAALAQLKTLSLNNNSLWDLEPLTRLTLLTSLSLDNNKLSGIKHLIALSRLETLYLRENRLNDFAYDKYIPAIQKRGTEVLFDSMPGKTGPLVRLIYFLPRDRQPQPDIDAKMDKLIKEVQQFYADQMEAHGYGRKTFQLEKDITGKAVVHRVKGQFEDAYYLSADSGDIFVGAWAEVREHFNTSQNVCLVAIDTSNQSISNTAAGISNTDGHWGGLVAIPSSGRYFNPPLAAHELGHTFGLYHDFHSSDRIMSLGPWSWGTMGSVHISECAAEWLDINRLFNINPTFLPDSPPTFKMLPPSTASTPNAIRLHFEINDLDGTHQVQLHTPAGVGLLSYKGLNGKPNSTVEFVVDRILPKRPEVYLRTIDVHGNFVSSQPFSIDNITDFLSPAKVVSIPDANLAAVIREALDLASDDTLTTHTMLNLTELYIPNRGVTNLTGLENALNLSYLHLGAVQINGEWVNNNAIASIDLSPLQGLTQLQTLILGKSKMRNLDFLRQLPPFKVVSIPDTNLAAAIRESLILNPETPIMTHAMLDLSYLHCINQGITNLTGLEHALNLSHLNLGEEYISGKGVVNSNAVSDFSPLSSLTQLTYLDISFNSLSDVESLAQLTNLTNLNLDRNQIKDVESLAQLTNLTNLNLDRNQINDVTPLTKLTNLTRLSLFENRILSNVAPLAKLTNLAYLELHSNNISDVAPLAKLTNLTSLFLGNNNISDVAPLAKLTNLTSLFLGNNNISDVAPLAKLTNLEILWLDRNHISDISPLVGLNLTGTQWDSIGLYIKDNPLSYTSINTHIPAMQAKDIEVSFDNVMHPALIKVSGDAQEGTTREMLPIPFIVEVQDEHGKPMIGVPVTFAVTAGGGLLSATTATTDATGRAQTTLTIGQTAGTNTVRATADGIQSFVIFTTTAVEAPLRMAEDVNGDGVVDIKDVVLVVDILVGANLEQTGQIVADVNGDGIVTVADLILVAAAIAEDEAAAPSSNIQDFNGSTVADIQRLLTQARQIITTDPVYLRGIAVLEQLLALLLPIETSLLPNYPNPFNPETWIPYQLVKPTVVTLHIYSVKGVLVRTLALGHQEAGIYHSEHHAAYWDGRNEQGERVASGIYFYTLTAGDFSATRKMLIRK